MTTGALPTTIAVSLSHDGSSWTDVTSYVRTAGISFSRGRNRVLGEWVPGTWNLYASNVARAIDPTNDAATFQARPGDEFKVAINGTTAFRGRVDAASVGYEKAGTYPTSSLTMSGTDGLATVARANVSDLADAPVGYGIYYTGALVGLVLALGTLDYFNAATIDAGDVATALPDTGTLNALQVIQTCTRTEGGNAQLFTLKDGTLRWRSRYARPSQVVVLGSSGVPYRDIQVDYTDDEWSNLVNVQMAQHVDPDQTSATSRTNGTGSKSFTLDALTSDGFGFSAGAGVFIQSTGSPGNTMTGTVTSFDESTRALVCDITSATGSSTRTDWVFTFTEPATTLSASDAQSRALFDIYRTGDVATYHRNTVEAQKAATLLAAERAFPSRRISTVSVLLGGGAMTAGQITTVLGLEIGDALDVSLALGTGTPSALRQVRQIDGIRHDISGTGSHLVTFTLGPEVSVNWTAVLKQNGSTVASTTNSATYTVNDQTCTAELLLTASGAGTNNTEIKVTPGAGTLPAPLVTGNKAMGEFTYNDGGTYYVGAATFDGTDIKLAVHNASAASPQLGQTPTLAIASPDVLSLSITYPI